jgi:putative endopeptidase
MTQSKKNKSKSKTKTKKNDNILCRKYDPHFNRFQEKYEEGFKNDLAEENRNLQKQLIQKFNTPFTPSKYKAQDDYYTYINYQWLTKKSEELKSEQKYYVQVDSFRMTQEKVYYELIDLAQKYIQTNNTTRSNAFKNVYESLYNLDESYAENAVKDTINTIDTIIAENDIYKLFALFNTNEIISWGAPVVWSVLPDEKNAKVYRSLVSAPQLSIYDYEIYIQDYGKDQDVLNYKKLFKRKYLQHIDAIFDACLGTNHGLKSQDIWDIEYELLNSLGCNNIKNDDPDNYNIVKASESLEKYNFDWNKFANYLGYEKIPSTFICTSLNYLKCIMDTLTKDNTWQTTKWRTYFIYINLRQIIRFHKKWHLIHYEFNEKFVKGQPAPWPREIYPVFGLSICFNTLLTNLYVEKNHNPIHIDYVNNMAHDLLIVFKRIIRRNKWLSPKTKKYALLKLQHIKLVIGSPKKLREDPLLNYDNKGAYQNMLKITKWRAKKLTQLEGKTTIDIPVIDWNEFKLVGTQAYVVNAYYTPTENSIYIPLAYIQKPFIDLDERGIEYNLAHIGYTLAHEMSHCLDDMGSKYDYKGNLFNWWSSSDRRKFNLKVKNVNKQYETFAGYDGIKMDASLSVGENLADISGLAICVEYLRDFQDMHEDIVVIRALSFHAFFTYVAVSSRQKIYDEAVKAQLKTNPHPMDKYRVNCPLARLELFRSLYNIQKGDKMFWPSMDTIW